MKKSKPYVQMKGAVPYYRLTWTEGGKRRERFIRLPADMDSAEFDRAYWSIRSGKSEALQKPAKQTWAELVAAYKAHPKYTKLAHGTRVSYSRILAEIVEKNGPKPVASLTRAMVRAIHQKHIDTPRKADWMVQIISLLCNFARLTLDWPVKNPAEGVELYGKQREFKAWPDWMVKALPKAPPMVQTAAQLILNTGQRPTAAIIMRRDQFRGEWMEVCDEKGDHQFEVYCPHALRDYLAALPITGAHVLPKNIAEPIGYHAIEKSFRTWRDKMGDKAKPYSLHGLRKLAIIRLAEAGCSDAQIQAITNQSLQMVAYYRKEASRKGLSKAAHALGTEQG